MGDSFFGFDTVAPPLSEEQLQSLGQGNNTYQDAQDIYDFNTLRHELGGDEPVDDDNLGDHLVEEGDDRNNVTFDDGPVGNDFDFSGNTQRISSNAISEEEAFYAKRKQQQQGASGEFHNPWAAVRDQTPERNGGGGGGGGNGNGFGKPKSIWGNFSSGENNYSPMDSQGSLSPFSGANRQRQSPFTSGSPLQGMSPTASSSFHYHHQQQQQQQQQPMRLEDIEKEMQRQQYRMDAAANSGGATQQPMSLAQVEAALAANTRSNQQQQPQQEQVPFGYPQDAVQMMAWKQQQELMEQLAMDREMKRRQETQKSKYDGLMTQYDKDYINRIQLSQLATGDPYADDFYYQVYSSLRQRAGLPTWQSTHTQDRRGKDNMSQRMQQQLQRIVNDAKRRPKLAQVSLEGALGKITSLTVRNPRQVLQVPSAHAEKQSEDETAETHETTTPDAVTPSPTTETKSKVYSKRSVLKLVEDIYSILLELEQMRRQGPPKVQELDEHRGDVEVLAIEASEIFRQKYNSKLDTLWATLRLNKENQDVPLLIIILSVPKGKKLIPRIVRQLSNEQNLELLRVVLAHFSKLDVSRNVIYPGTMVADAPEARQQSFVSFDAVELFFSVTMPSLLTLIAESSLQVVNQLLHVVDYTIAHSKPGLAFLTMLLSRGEILKQGGGALQGLPPPSDEELNAFKELYQALFQSLQGRYLSIFPSLYYLVPINPNTPMIQIVLGVDDMYVWQFLAALAVGASMDQQHILVTEVRERVMENIIIVKRNRVPLEQANHCIANINLFLHALGLDASQVSVPL